MGSTTCGVCGLRNDETRTACLRCGDALGGATERLGPEGGAWREGDLVVVRKSSALPDRCVRCGAPSGSLRLRQRYYWHHPALYILAFGAVLVYAIVALAVRKSATLDLGLCAHHSRRRRRALVGGWSCAGLGVLALGTSLVADKPAFVALAVALFLAGLLWGMLGAAPLRATHIDDDFVRLKGAGPGFLRGLPTVGAFR
jgi:hypothetical protein